MALANSQDQYHQAAVKCLEGLRSLKTLFVTTNFVLDETYTRLRVRAGVRVAVLFGEKIRTSRETNICTVDTPVEKAAWEIFKKYHDHDLSYTDCTSFAFMRLKKIKEAFTFDNDFKIFGWHIHPIDIL